MSEAHPDAYRKLVGSSLVDGTLETLNFRLGPDFTIPHITRNLLGEMQDSGINFKHLVGGAIYIASFVIGQMRTQQEIAAVLEISTTSVRNGQRAILKAIPLFKDAIKRFERDGVFKYYQWFDVEVRPKYGMES